MKTLLKTSSLVVLASIGLAGGASAQEVLNVYNWSDYIGCLLYTSDAADE